VVEASGEPIVISSIVLFELWYGVFRSDRPQVNGERLNLFLASDVGVLPFESEDTAIAGELRRTLEQTGRPIGPYDILIAAQALRRGATLVTANAAEFARVPGLTWEDWTT
jgi:tRNA(fMet)-specific endonuclease VapC